MCWLKRDIEQIPLPDETVDVVTSNCVINLSADTPQVIREAARVLKLGTVIVTATVSSLAGLLGN